MEPKVIFEDSEILVLDKPCGMIVNRSDTTKGEKTVQEWVESRLVIPNLFRDPGSNEMLNQVQHDMQETDFNNRGGIVHRLDKETSGVLLVAKNPQAFENLQRQFKDRLVKKTYIALAHGNVEPKEGEINISVGRLPWNRKRFGVLAGGREAVTKYKILRYYDITVRARHSGKLSQVPDGTWLSASRISIVQRDSGQARMTVLGGNEKLTLLELYPQTGRTHQIRVHMKYINHPIFSDELYAGRKTARNDRKLLPRIFLHASQITFNHPKTNKTASFESKLPEDLEQFLDSMRGVDL